MGNRKQGETEKLLRRVSELLAGLIEFRDRYGRLREKAFQKVNALLVAGMSGVKRELEETDDVQKVQRIIRLGERIQNLARDITLTAERIGGSER
jgi:hypothetical protein